MQLRKDAKVIELPAMGFGAAVASIAVVEDDASQAELVARWLCASGHRVTIYPDGASCAALLPDAPVDAILLDMNLPGTDGLELLHRLQQGVAERDYRPILVLTADERETVRQQALELGAADFLAKPIAKTDLLLRVRNHLRIRGLTKDLQAAQRSLQDRLVERSRDLISARAEILDRLARAAEYRDDATGQHARRVGALAGAIARAIRLPEEQASLIEQAAPLHDVGKIGIPDEVLLKPGRFNDSERKMMDMHTEIGAYILGGSDVPVLKVASEIAATHHEWWNGSGTLGLEGEDIPISGRIVNVADVYDALTNERPYKSAWTAAEALTEIRAGAGTRHDPRIVAALHTVVGFDWPAVRELGEAHAA